MAIGDDVKSKALPKMDMQSSDFRHAELDFLALT